MLLVESRGTTSLWKLMREDPLVSINPDLGDCNNQ
jgi:hypothetical protein